MLTSAAKAYLESRTYTIDLMSKEEILSFGAGTFSYEGTEIRSEGPSVGWVSRSMGGNLIGLQTRRIDERQYRWFQAPKAQHLPIIYGTEADHETLFNTGEMMVTEGIFDRAALKRCFPDRAIYARLSKGIAKQLLFFTERYAKTVWLVFDQDEPGKRSTRITEERLGKSTDINLLNFPYKDPAKFLERKGEDYMRNYLKRQIEALSF